MEGTKYSKINADVFYGRPPTVVAYAACCSLVAFLCRCQKVYLHLAFNCKFRVQKGMHTDTLLSLFFFQPKIRLSQWSHVS